MTTDDQMMTELKEMAITLIPNVFGSHAFIQRKFDAKDPIFINLVRAFCRRHGVQ